MNVSGHAGMTSHCKTWAKGRTFFPIHNFFLVTLIFVSQDPAHTWPSEAMCPASSCPGISRKLFN